MKFKMFRVLTVAAALLAAANGFAQSTPIETKVKVAHSHEEYDQLKAGGHEVVMDMSTYSSKKITPKVWTAAELEEQETAKLLGGGNSDDCNCLKAIDKTYAIVPMEGYTAPEYRNDDASSPEIELPFTFCLYGTNYTSCFINNNGNVSFGAAYSTFSSSGFPNADFVMVAPFWADVDTRPAESGLPWYKITDHYMIVIWDHVGYYSQQTDKLNTFQLIISDGTDPIIPNGNNVSFCYGDMEWTTGSASSGVGGFGGTPATVGVNEGDGVSFMQAGRFDHAGTDYDGPTGAFDGVSWLDNQIMPINSCDATSGNLIPIAPVLTLCDTLYVCAGNDIDLQFLGPEVDQTLTITYTLSDETTGLVFTPVVNTGASQLNINAPVGTPDTMVDIQVTATDNGTPAQSVTLYYTIVVISSAPPIEILGVPVICSGQSTNLSIAAGYSNIAWNTGSAASMISVSETGTYSVTANLGGCETSGSIEVVAFDIVVPTISGETLICSNATTTLTVTPSYVSYDWSDNSSTPTITVGPGTYSVTATDENGCASSDSFTIGSIPAVTVGPDDLICDGFTADLTGSDRPGAWTFSSDDGTATFEDATQTDTEVTVSGYGVYTFDFHDTECDAHDQTVLTFLPSPNFYFPTDTFACLQGSLYLYPDGANASYFNWYWEGIDVENQGVVYNVTSLDSTFQWSATNACGTDQGTVHVLAELCEIFIPNVFTPDGDDFNQSFEIVGIENFDGSTLQVFNRWGKMVFESSNYSNNWNPSEDEAADGVYYYVLGLNRNSGTEYFSGHVTLIRNPK